MTGMTAPWSEEQTEQLLCLSAEGLSAAQIARRMEVSRNAVLGKLNRLRGPGGARRGAAAAHEQAIIAMVEEGKADAAIAAGLGLSADQVRHVRRRHSLRRAAAGRPASAAAAAGPAIARLARDGHADAEIARRLSLSVHAVRGMRARLGIKGNKPGPREAPVRNIQMGDGADRILAVFAEGFMGQRGRVSLMQLQPGMCRFPVDQPEGAVMFCGLPAEEGRSWCAAHAARCCSAPPPRPARLPPRRLPGVR